MNLTQELGVREHTAAAPETPPTAETVPAKTPSFAYDTQTRPRTIRRHPWAFAFRLLHALVEAGPPTAASDVLPLVGPNGGPVWMLTGTNTQRRPAGPEDGSRWLR